MTIKGWFQFLSYKGKIEGHNKGHFYLVFFRFGLTPPCTTGLQSVIFLGPPGSPSGDFSLLFAGADVTKASVPKV
jgi:hypothetical protein